MTDSGSARDSADVGQGSAKYQDGRVLALSVRVPLFRVRMPDRVLHALEPILFSGYIGQGPQVKKFEQQLGEYLGQGQVVTTCSGTAALELAFRLIGLGPGDVVVSTPMTCLATNLPILATGAHIVWADIDPRTGNVQPESVRARMGPQVKAIVVVHWGGLPADLAELNAISQKWGVPIVEDAAHAFGAEYQGQKIGCHSEFVMFSFQAIKLLTTGDGGLLALRDVDTYQRARRLRWYGLDRDVPDRELRCEQTLWDWGLKWHMNDICATIGLAGLADLAGALARARANAAYYDQVLPAEVRVPVQSDRQSSYWLYTIHVPDPAGFQQRMLARGVHVSPVHRRNDQQPVFRASQRPLPGVDQFSRTAICIPVGWWVSDEDRAYVAESVLACL